MSALLCALNEARSREMLPLLCTVCCAANGDQVVPDRNDVREVFWYEIMCPLCVDTFLDVFPIRPRDVLDRQVVGSLARSIRRRRPRAAPRPNGEG